MHKILLVDDSQLICSFLSKKIKAQLNAHVDIAHSFEEARALVEANSDYFLALLDVHLQDLDDTTMAEYILEKKIPSIIMTADFDEKLHQEFKSLDIIDYVLKETPESINYIVKLIDRLIQNRSTKVLVIDDSLSVRNYLTILLENQLFNVFSAKEPLEAFKIIEENNDIKIIITDYNMPNLNGVEFLKIIRRNFSKDDVAVIGISTDEDSAISFLKHGANDFLKKPFFKEEFVCRINNTAEALENANQLREIANTDFLTKVSNRKYFFEVAQSYFEESKEADVPFAIAMIDIDNFKSINDTHGHNIGDEVIKTLSKILRSNIKGQDIVARFGGEEFVLYLKDIPAEPAIGFMQNLCKKIANTDIVLDEQTKINFTVSIGLVTTPETTLVETINKSDKLLYEAKNGGKNRVESDLVTA